MDFSKDTNANWPDDSKGLACIGSTDPENAGQRQDAVGASPRRHGSGYPGFAGTPQEPGRDLAFGKRSGYPGFTEAS